MFKLTKGEIFIENLFQIEFLKFWPTINLHWGPVRPHTKFGPFRLLLDRQTNKVYIFIIEKNMKIGFLLKTKSICKISISLKFRI